MQIDLETGEMLEDGSEEELAEWVQLLVVSAKSEQILGRRVSNQYEV